MNDKKEFVWSERKIQRKLISQYWSSSILLMPNYTPWQWFECDLFRVTKSLCFYEYEIKLTVSDFKADARKICSTSFWDENGHWQRGPNRHKHDLLRERSEKGPKRFYYVVPEGLESQIEVPEFAGLMVAHARAVHTTEIKRAPVLSKAQVEQKTIAKARERAYYRYLHLIGRDERGDND